MIASQPDRRTDASDVTDAGPAESDTLNSNSASLDRASLDRASLDQAGMLVRVLALLVAVGLITPLVIARTLSPSPAGIGTHQQLGLPPCSMQVLFDVRCPACGMTTSWSYWTRGQWWASAGANVGGACLAFLTALVAAIAARVVWTDRWPRTVTMNRVGWSIIVIGAITLVDWLVRLAG